MLMAGEGSKAQAQTQAQITSLKIQLPKRQHRLLVGKAVDEIMTESRCSVTVPSPEDTSEDLLPVGGLRHYAV